jgi:hypothetical protein
MIVKLKSGQYRLYSLKKNPKTGKRRNLGTFATRAAAEKHERAVQLASRSSSPRPRRPATTVGTPATAIIGATRATPAPITMSTDIPASPGTATAAISIRPTMTSAKATR